MFNKDGRGILLMSQNTFQTIMGHFYFRYYSICHSYRYQIDVLYI